MFDAATVQMLIDGTIATLVMTLVTTVASYLIGIPVGILLTVTQNESLMPRGGMRPVAQGVNTVVGAIVNILRSVPFLILMITVAPITKALVGTTIGTRATIVALIIAAAPFVARLVEQSLMEVDPGVIEAAQSMGANTGQIVTKVLLSEAKPSLLNGAMISAVTILGYSAMAGFVGGGGLGDIAIRFGYYRYETEIMLVTVVLLVLLVQILQMVGGRIARRSDKRNND